MILISDDDDDDDDDTWCWLVTKKWWWNEFYDIGAVKWLNCDCWCDTDD